MRLPACRPKLEPAREGAGREDMPTRDVTIGVVGSGGDGVVTLGDLVAQVAAQEGLHVIKTEAYGPQIRGGESSCTVRVAADEIFAQGASVDVLVVFGWADFARFRGEISVAPDAFVLYEQTEDRPSGEDLGLVSGEGLSWIPVPFAAISRASSGTPGSKNVVTLGILGELLGLPAETLKRGMARRFGRKKASVLEANTRAFEAGLEFGASQAPAFAKKRLDYTPSAPRLLLSGNEAAAIGALHAGCRFFAGYPITPSSEILHFLAEWMPRTGGSFLQTEDELAAIGAVIGASFAGVKSMTATSGPGLSLMVEMLGLAAMAEVPVVIIDVQRGGPSTGNPTKSEQSDLLQCLFGTHGDAPRVVLACSDVEDCFHATVEAFNISEEFQIPVLVLSDQAVGQRKETIPAQALQHEVRGRLKPTDAELESYERYRETPNGVSPMSVPGMKKGMYQTNGLEHDAEGRPNSLYLTHETMNAKRYRKLWPIRERYHAFRRFGPARADVGVLCWGSSSGPVQEAVAASNARGETLAAFVPQTLYPFPKRDFEEFLASVGELLIVELSYTAQFYKYLRTFLDLPARRTHVFKRSGGKDLTGAEVLEAVSRACAATRREKVAV
jgi:2-oxoglutarate ferredoxin oxidoreductase subunit alpha